MTRDEVANADVYLIHFSKAFGHAKHYAGMAKAGDVDRRFKEHCSGSNSRGSRLMYHVVQAGIEVSIAKVWYGGGHQQELKLKQSGKSRFCPMCKGK